MQKRIMPSFSLIGLVASIYFGSLFMMGCESVNQGFVKVVEVHAKEIAEDYERHLKAEDNPLFIRYELAEDGHYVRVEKPTYSDREKIIKSRFRSVEELLRVIQEQKEGEKE